MSPRSSRTLASQVALIALLYPFWIFQTAGYGAMAIWRFVHWLKNRKQIGRQTTCCARGHEVPLYGVYQCACGSIHEGRVFGPCRVCKESCGWTPCPECGLPVQNPNL